MGIVKALFWNRKISLVSLAFIKHNISDNINQERNNIQNPFNPLWASKMNTDWKQTIEKIYATNKNWFFSMVIVIALFTYFRLSTS